MPEIDKVVHSSVGLGSILSTLISIFLILIELEYLIIIIPIFLAGLKEIIDKFILKGKADKKDFLSTLNPLIVIKWYKERRGI